MRLAATGLPSVCMPVWGVRTTVDLCCGSIDLPLNWLFMFILEYLFGFDEATVEEATTAAVVNVGLEVPFVCALISTFVSLLV